MFAKTLVNEILVHIVDVLARHNAFIVAIPARQVYRVLFAFDERNAETMNWFQMDALRHGRIVVHDWRIGDAAIDGSEGNHPRHVFGLERQE